MPDKKTENDGYLTFLSWFFGIGFILNISLIYKFINIPKLAIISALSLFISGILILPPIIKKLPNSENFRLIKFYLVLALIIIGFVNYPMPDEAIVKSNKAYLYSDNNGKKIIATINRFQKISIYKKAYTKSGYYKTDNDLWIKRDNVALSANDPEIKKIIQQKNESNTKREQQNAYLSFQQQVSDIEKPCNTYQAQLSTKLVNESGNLVEIYELAKQGNYICSEASTKISQVTIPNKLAKENIDKLKKVKEYMSNSLILKSMAMDEIQKFVDDNKISRVSKAKEYFQSGQSAVLMAGVQLADVKISIENKSSSKK